MKKILLVMLMLVVTNLFSQSGTIERQVGDNGVPFLIIQYTSGNTDRINENEYQVEFRHIGWLKPEQGLEYQGITITTRLSRSPVLIIEDYTGVVNEFHPGKQAIFRAYGIKDEVIFVFTKYAGINGSDVWSIKCETIQSASLPKVIKLE